MRDKRAKNPLLNSIERGMMKDALRLARNSDRVREANLRGEKAVKHAGIAGIGLPLSPAQKLVRKFAIRKAIRAKIKSEVSNAKETD